MNNRTYMKSIFKSIITSNLKLIHINLKKYLNIFQIIIEKLIEKKYIYILTDVNQLVSSIWLGCSSYLLL